MIMKLLHWPLMGGLHYISYSEEGLGGAAARPGPSPPRCTKYSSPINGQCTSHHIGV